MNEQALLTGTLKAANQVVFDLYPETGEAIVNDVHTILLSYDPKKIKKKDTLWKGKLHSEDRGRVLNFFEKNLHKKRNTINVEFRLETPDRAYKWVHFYGKVIEHSESKKTIRMVGVQTDIRQRKMAEQTMTAYHYRQEVITKIYNAITKSNKPEQIAKIILNNLGKLVKNDLAAVGLFFNNQKNIRLFSYSDDSHFLEEGEVFNNEFTENVARLTKGEVLVVDDLKKAERITEVGKKMLEHGLASHISIPLKSGKEVCGIMSIGSKIPKYFDEEKQEIIIELANQLAISLRQAQLQEQVSLQNQELEKRVRERTRQLERANKELESFSYSVSHDLQTPVRAINGYSNILKEEYREKLDDEGKRLLDNIIQNTDHMNNLITDILALTRISQVKTAGHSVNLNKVITECLISLNHETKERNIVWKIDELPRISADQGLIKQLFINLISNAIKFTKNKKEALIEIGVQRTRNENIFFVKDNGVGFDMKYSSKMFKVFQRLHDQKDYRGTGVGLAIVKQIVEKFDGRVWAESIPKRGTVIYFTFFSN